MFFQKEKVKTLILWLCPWIVITYFKFQIIFKPEPEPRTLMTRQQRLWLYRANEARCLLHNVGNPGPDSWNAWESEGSSEYDDARNAHFCATGSRFPEPDPERGGITRMPYLGSQEPAAEPRPEEWYEPFFVGPGVPFLGTVY
ncbi:unnamed protein product [Polarella glacialis]|uniref:Uncharacterized protein n=1 Tax=Polarella glacialis TaxID=89957 RepID=A0A813J5M9_POLGL|nr:unnamed protein product [Polarella glacialis]